MDDKVRKAIRAAEASQTPENMEKVWQLFSQAGIRGCSCENEHCKVCRAEGCFYPANLDSFIEYLGPFCDGCAEEMPIEYHGYDAGFHEDNTKNNIVCGCKKCRKLLRLYSLTPGAKLPKRRNYDKYVGEEEYQVKVKVPVDLSSEEAHEQSLLRMVNVGNVLNEIVKRSVLPAEHLDTQTRLDEEGYFDYILYFNTGPGARRFIENVERALAKPELAVMGVYGVLVELRVG